MNIIICGAGRVGFSISKQLSAQGHSITVIDQSSEFIQKINDTQDVKGIVGRATFPSVLEKAGAEDADMIIAVTQNDETNMVICQVAYSIFKINKKIARIRGQEFLGGKWGKLYGESNLPIDVVISPELEVAKSLQRNQSRTTLGICERGFGVSSRRSVASIHDRRFGARLCGVQQSESLASEWSIWNSHPGRTRLRECEVYSH